MHPMVLACKTSVSETGNMWKIPVHNLLGVKPGYRNVTRLSGHQRQFLLQPVYVAPAVVKMRMWRFTMYSPHLYMFKFLVWSIYVLSAGAFASSLRYNVAWCELLHDIDNAFHGYSFGFSLTVRLISYIFEGCRLLA
jgi:hypothetical protein